MKIWTILLTCLLITTAHAALTIDKDYVDHNLLIIAPGTSQNFNFHIINPDSIDKTVDITLGSSNNIAVLMINPHLTIPAKTNANIPIKITMPSNSPTTSLYFITLSTRSDNEALRDILRVQVGQPNPIPSNPNMTTHPKEQSTLETITPPTILHPPTPPTTIPSQSCISGFKPTSNGCILDTTAKGTPSSGIPPWAFYLLIIILVVVAVRATARKK
jgi:hypothetical protein